MKLFLRIALTVVAFVAALLVMLNWHTLPVQLLVAIIAAIVIPPLVPKWYQSLVWHWHTWEAKRASKTRIAAAQAAATATTAGQNPVPTRGKVLPWIFATVFALISATVTTVTAIVVSVTWVTTSDWSAMKALIVAGLVVIGIAVTAALAALGHWLGNRLSQ